MKSSPARAATARPNRSTQFRSEEFRAPAAIAQLRENCRSLVGFGLVAFCGLTQINFAEYCEYGLKAVLRRIKSLHCEPSPRSRRTPTALMAEQRVIANHLDRS